LGSGFWDWILDLGFWICVGISGLTGVSEILGVGFWIVGLDFGFGILDFGSVFWV
jgi:hypothetical protein